ncbi:XRE family transcriptional regulator [Pseudomonas sp. GM67]|uniref:XRE family transcriptional regulator n=1 Tax=Pseudomonas sp. GM67 TaxID=1144335 RepID=UPI000270C36E|nr:helix-turn-helix transcriptional regulator [Pseudomonas sp. GM67]EJM92444.1 putative transcriptional regulator [Pseudomonas sp. GM67]
MQEDKRAYNVVKMNTLANRIKMARQGARLTQKKLAELVGVEQPVISQLETGKNLQSAHIAKIAHACSVSAIWLSDGIGEMKGRLTHIEANAELLGDMDTWEDGESLDDDEYEIPYFAEVEFAGGQGMSEVVEIADRKLRFSGATLKAAGVEAKSAACARIKGRSMERLILDGAAIGFDLDDTSIIDGEIYAFNQLGMLRVKYLHRLPGGSVRIRSENSEDFPDEVMTAEQFADDVRMLGRVFWWSTVRRSPRRK